MTLKTQAKNYTKLAAESAKLGFWNAVLASPRGKLGKPTTGSMPLREGDRGGEAATELAAAAHAAVAISNRRVRLRDDWFVQPRTKK